MRYTNSFVRKRGGAWQGVAKYKDPHGAWHSRSRTFPADVKTERQARNALTDWLIELERDLGDCGVDANSRVSDYIEDFLGMLQETGSVEPSTIRDYRHSADRVSKTIGGSRMRELCPKLLQDWERDMLKSYSATTVAKTHRFLKQVCAHAVAMGDLVKSPFGGVRPPKVGMTRPNALKRADRAALSNALSQLEPTPLVTGVAMALYEGMREGEVCALRWKDCDLKAGLISIEQSVGRTDGGFYLKQPKNATSRRTIAIAPGLAPFLRRRRVEMIERRMDAGLPFSEDLFVIGSVDGSFCSPEVLSHGWTQLSRAMGLVGTQGKTVTFHDLRHSFATTAISEGADVASVAGVLGHANVAMTLNVYADADPMAKRAAMAMVNAVTDVEPSEGCRVVEFRRAGSQ